MDFIVYNTITGQITKLLQLPDYASDLIRFNINENESYIEAESVSPNEKYIVDGQIVDRPSFDISVPENIVINEEVVFGNVPENTVVSTYFAGERHEIEIDDGTFEFETNTPGFYQIKFVCWPYQDKIIDITVGE